MFAPTDCTIAQCGSKNCKTCKILITDNSFSSNFTKRSFTTHSFDNLSCKSTNLVYGIECGLCGLIYVGETKGQLRSRMNGHRFQINHGGNQLLYRHFNLPDHSILSMKVRILEKIYHPTNNPSLSTPFRRKREEHWIRQLGTAAPYGCNDHIDSIGNLTSPGCQSVNVLNLFDRTSRRHRSHGSRKYNKPEIHDVSFDGLLPFVNLQLGLHHIRTKLCSLPLKRLHALYESTLTLHFADVGPPEHRLQGIILDISSNRLFIAVRVDEPTETRNRPSNSPIKALTLWMLATFWTRSPSKIKSLRTFNTRSRHAFPIALLVLLLPKSSITKQVYSNLTFKVFLMIPHLATARIQNFFTLHVAI